MTDTASGRRAPGLRQAGTEPHSKTARNPRGAGRPRFVFDDETRALVKELAGIGVRHIDIARVIKYDGQSISADALRNHFEPELEEGRIEAGARVAKTLYELAVGGECPAATFFFCKTRLGYRETTKHEHTGAEGQPLPAVLPSFVVQFVESGTPAAGEGGGDDEI